MGQWLSRSEQVMPSSNRLVLRISANDSDSGQSHPVATIVVSSSSNVIECDIEESGTVQPETSKEQGLQQGQVK